MYRLIIVDDEDIIRQGIANSLNWNDYGFELVGEAASGQEAWEIIQKYQPELIISDIYMPGVDGIELAERVRSQFPETIVVFLSGYNDFDYAQKAIELGIFRYLTKPVQVEELAEILNEAREEIEYKHREQDRLKKIMEQVYKSLPLLRENFFKKLVLHQVPEEELQDTLEFLDLEIPGDGFVVFIVSLDDSIYLSRRYKGTEFQLMKLSVMDILRERLTAVGYYPFTFQVEEDEIAVLCGFDSKRVRDIKDDLYREISNIQLIIKKQLRITVSIALGNEVKRLIEAGESYAQARAAIEYKMIAGKNSILYYSDIEQMGEEKVLFSFGRNNELIQSIRAGNEELAVSLAREAFDQIKEKKIIRKNHICIIIAELVNQVVRVVMENSDSLDEVYGKDFDPYAELYRNETLEDIRLWFEDLIRKTIKHLNQRIKASTRRFVDKAREYIEAHYQEGDLSLKRIAQEVFISPCYLSQIFKQVMGESVTEYITKVRIEKAKKLLKDTSLKAYEIAYQVGFKDAHYFSLCFKKVVGISPSEYRDYIDFDIKL